MAPRTPEKTTTPDQPSPKSLRLNEDFLQAQNKGRHRRKPARQAGFKDWTTMSGQGFCNQSSTFNHPFYPLQRVMAGGKKCGIIEQIPQFQQRRRPAMTTIFSFGLDQWRGRAIILQTDRQTDRQHSAVRFCCADFSPGRGASVDLFHGRAAPFVVRGKGAVPQRLNRW